MIRLKDSQQVTLSKIDAVVVSLNTNSIRNPGLVEAGMKAIHSAIVAKK
jgi:hypothetical protein